MMRYIKKTPVLFLIFVYLGMRITAAEPSGEIQIELNKVEQNNNDCRIHMVALNQSEFDLLSLKLSLVLFDLDGIVLSEFAATIPPLPPQKTKYSVYDLPGLECENIGRVLLNDALECTDQTGSMEACLELLSTTFRTETPFVM